jgi:hypothetical protein
LTDKYSSTFQLVVASVIWKSNVISNHGPNQHKLSCASLLVAHAKSLKSNKAHTITPSLSLKFIGASISEEAQFAPTTLQAFKFIVAPISIANFQLIVDLFLIPNREGARAVGSHINQFLREQKQQWQNQKTLSAATILLIMIALLAESPL